MKRLIILLAAVAALALVPAAAQAAPGVEHLTVNITGTGSGEVNSTEGNPYEGSPRLNCKYNGTEKSGTCKVLMSNEGEGFEAVLAHAVAAPGSKFVKWTIQHGEFEGCGTFGGCFPYVEPEETGEDNSEITAIFEKETPKDLLKIEKTGEGTVVSSPAGIECGVKCEAEFEEGSTVTLTASPAAGYAFSAWGGCTEHVGLTCKVLMSKNPQVVKVTFIATPSLTIEKAGSGYGKVAATGISCDESCSKESAAVKTGTAVTVKVTPAKGNEFATFEGGTGNAGSCSATCTFTISENSSVKVKFSPIPTKTLTVKLKGPGAYKGKVSGKGVTVKGLVSTAILCGSGCTTETESFFATGETELVATASTGYAFKGWTVSGGSAGTCTGTTSPCKLLTDANKTVEAEFK